MAEGTRFCPNCGGAAASSPQAAATQPAPAPYTAQPAPPYAAPPAAGYGYNAPYLGQPQWDAPSPAAPYAGFWRRFLAHLIDGLILGVVFIALMVALGMLGMTAAMASGDNSNIGAIFALLPLYIAVTVLGGWLYFALQESSTRQATLGKLAIGIKVTDLEGNRLSFGGATGRYFAKIVTSLVPFGIGWMLAGWTARKQAIHDMLASTLVVCR